MSRPHERAGLPIDPNCAHCVLAEPLQAFLDSHKHKNDSQILGELLELACDFFSSRVPPDEVEDYARGAMATFAMLLSRAVGSARNGTPRAPRAH